MEYKKPRYEWDSVVTNDVMSTSGTKLEGGAQLAENDSTSANIFTSIFDILTLK